MKVVSTGSKSEMIERIIQKSSNIPTAARKERDKWFKTLNDVNEYGLMILIARDERYDYYDDTMNIYYWFSKGFNTENTH